jgi:REP element-mobilizing transposase RayT
MRGMSYPGITHMSNDADTPRAGLKPAPTNRHGLPELARALKTFSAKRVNQLRGTPGMPMWQRSYYEHVIRNEKSMNHIRQYIVNNPLQ